MACGPSIDNSVAASHQDASANTLAKSVRAKAFTVGRHLFFGAGQFEPETPRGQRLIAHELTHVLQQRVGLRSVQREVLARDADLGAAPFSGRDCRRPPSESFQSPRAASVLAGNRAPT